MNLDTSKTILKVFGYISVVLGILGIIIGIIAIAGGSLVGIGSAMGEMPSNISSSDAVAAIGLLGFGGLLLLIASVIDVTKGVFSVKAAKDINKIMPAWVFALISLILTAISAITTFMNGANNQAGTNFVGIIIDVIIEVLIFVAADNIKKAAGK